VTAGKLYRRIVVAVASQPSVERFTVHSAAMRGVVGRFVAGDSLAAALTVARFLHGRGMRVTLDNLGENTTSAAAATLAVDEAIAALEQLRQHGYEANVSVKLTQLGLDLGEHIVTENVQRLLARARSLDGFVRIDMEGSSYTGRTIEVFSDLRSAYENVGIVLQAYLYRTAADVEQLVAQQARIRLCKGAYKEAPHISFRRKRDTDRNYVRLMEYLLRKGNFPAFATHDAAIIDHACGFAKEHDIRPDQFEFQMLYGVRRDLQESLVSKGYGVRIYVPYGKEWYPYLTRRLAERPANALFIVRHALGEERTSEAARYT